MFLCSLNWLSSNAKPWLAILVTVVVTWSNLSSSLHLLGVVDKSLDSRPKELQSLRLALWQKG